MRGEVPRGGFAWAYCCVALRCAVLCCAPSFPSLPHLHPFPLPSISTRKRRTITCHPPIHPSIQLAPSFSFHPYSRVAATEIPILSLTHLPILACPTLTSTQVGSTSGYPVLATPTPTPSPGPCTLSTHESSLMLIQDFQFSAARPPVLSVADCHVSAQGLWDAVWNVK